MTSKWERFKQSNIAKIVIAYSLVVWVLIQLIEAVLPTFETPLWVAQTLTFLLILGFPIALLVGWAYEALPTNASRSEGHSSAPQLVQSTPKKTLVLVGIGSCITIGLFGFYLMPFIFDQSGFENRQTLQSPSESNIRSGSFRSSVMLGLTGIRGLHNTRTDIAVSSDGLKLAYTLTDGTGTQKVRIRDLTQVNQEREVATLETVGGSGLLFFSEDEDWLHFIAGGTLARIRIEGGSIQYIDQGIQVLRSGFTSFEEKVIFSNATDGKLYEISVAGGEPKLLESMGELSSEEPRWFTWPRRLAGSQHILTTSASSETVTGNGNIEIHDLETGEIRSLIQNASNATYLEAGFILFVRDSDLWAVPFDLESLETIGSETPIIEGIESNGSYGHAAYAVSSDGKLFYLPGEDVGTTLNMGQMTWVDRTGKFISTVMEQESIAHLKLSPTEDQVAFTRYDNTGSSDIFVWDFDRNTLGRLTFEGQSSRPIWSADGSNIFYSHSNEGIKSVAANGTDLPETIFASNERTEAWAHTSDGLLVFDKGSPPQIYVLGLAEDIGTPQERQATELDLAPTLPLYHGVDISPDGNWISYVSMETGQNQVYVRPFPNIDGGKWQASTDGGLNPIWNRTESELFFFNGNRRQQWVVNYEVAQFDRESKPNFINFGPPRQMFARDTTLSPATQPVWGYSSSRGNFLLIEQPGTVREADDAVLARQTNLVVVDDINLELKSLTRRFAN